MTVDDIWTCVYDKGYREGKQTLSSDLIQLWHYIDFTLYVGNGGAGGFLYNNSPALEEESRYQPYIACWRFFHYSDLADAVEKYEQLYLKALKAFQKNKKVGFEKQFLQMGLGDLSDEIELKIKEVTENNEKVWEWMEKNKEKLEAEMGNYTLPTQ